MQLLLITYRKYCRSYTPRQSEKPVNNSAILTEDVASCMFLLRIFNTLMDTIRNSKATVLIGVTGQTGAFSKEILAQMTKDTKLSLIMPISNPTFKVEYTPDIAIRPRREIALSQREVHFLLSCIMEMKHRYPNATTSSFSPG